MYSLLRLLLISLSVIPLFSCDKDSSNSSTTSPSVNVQTTNPSQQVPSPTKEEIITKEESIVFESNRELMDKLGAFNQGDPMLMKKLGTSIGKPIEIRSMVVHTVSDKDYIQGGKLILVSDGSLGWEYSVWCYLSPKDGDKYMELTKKRRNVAVVGTIKDYSRQAGLWIDPCQATWEKE